MPDQMISQGTELSSVLSFESISVRKLTRMYSFHIFSPPPLPLFFFSSTKWVMFFPLVEF